jgi:hypothetical protein
MQGDPVVRRRFALIAIALIGALGLAFAPAAGGAKSNTSETKGNAPTEQRCDPQPDRGNGPPAGKGTKKCAS